MIRTEKDTKSYYVQWMKCVSIGESSFGFQALGFRSQHIGSTLWTREHVIQFGLQKLIMCFTLLSVNLWCTTRKTSMFSTQVKSSASWEAQIDRSGIWRAFEHPFLQQNLSLNLFFSTTQRSSACFIRKGRSTRTFAFYNMSLRTSWTFTPYQLR